MTLTFKWANGGSRLRGGQQGNLKKKGGQVSYIPNSDSSCTAPRGSRELTNSDMLKKKKGRPTAAGFEPARPKSYDV